MTKKINKQNKSKRVIFENDIINALFTLLIIEFNNLIFNLHYLINILRIFSMLLTKQFDDISEYIFEYISKYNYLSSRLAFAKNPQSFQERSGK